MKDTLITVVKVVAYGVGYVTKAIEIGYKEGQKACKIEHTVDKINTLFGAKEKVEA